MQTKKLLLAVFTGINIASFSLIGCTPQQQEFEPESQQPSNTNTVADTSGSTTTAQGQQLDVPYVPTPQPVVERMLELGQVDKNDILYDLGSGDGRIPITAAKKYGAQGVGIDLNPERVQEAKTNAKEAGVSNQVKFIQGDLFEADLSDATVVTLYLLSSVNEKLRPKLLKELKPGTKIVSHAFGMGEWEPETVEQVDGKTIYVWTVPENPPANLLEN